MLELKIDSEFQNKIPPLSEAEFNQLRDNILEAGEIFDPIVTWNGIIVDGHNRYKIIRENPSIRWRTREMKFADKWEAFEWMYKNQLGRRNLTDEQRTYMMGKMYEARKNTVGGDRGNQYTKEASAQNAHMANERTPRTDEIVGDELGVNHATVRRAYNFAQGVDALKEVSKDAADKVLRGEANITKAAVQKIKDLDGEAKEHVAKAIEQGEQVQATKAADVIAPKRNVGRPSETQERMRIIEEAYKPMIDDSAREKFNVDDLVEEIKVNGANYAAQLRRTIAMRSELLNEDGAREKARIAVDEIISAIMNVRSLI